MHWEFLSVMLDLCLTTVNIYFSCYWESLRS